MKYPRCQRENPPGAEVLRGVRGTSRSGLRLLWSVKSSRAEVLWRVRVGLVPEATGKSVSHTPKHLVDTFLTSAHGCRGRRDNDGAAGGFSGEGDGQ